MSTDSSCRRLLVLLFCTGFAWSIFAKSDPPFPPNDSTLMRMDSAALSITWFKPDIRADMVQYAKNFLGIHYRYGGRAPETGFDCSGLTHFVMKHFDVPVSPCSRTQFGDGQKVDLKAVKPGDLIFFRRSSKSRISHVAMVVANDAEGLFIIHSTSRGVVVDDLMKSNYWRPKIYAAKDVLHRFSDTYARQQLELFATQIRQLQALELDLGLLAKSIRI